MQESAWSARTEIEYNNKRLVIRIIEREELNNGWIDFGVKSDDDTFLRVFGKNPIPMPIKPKEEFKPEYDLFQNTPEQVELAKRIWHEIQRMYF